MKLIDIGNSRTLIEDYIPPHDDLLFRKWGVHSVSYGKNILVPNDRLHKFLEKEEIDAYLAKKN